MKKEKSPAFQWYPKDMETDEVVKLMDNRQYGIYCKLLGHNWIEGSIPAEVKHLATIVREDPKDFEIIWPLISRKFRKKGKDRLTNPRQEKERKKQRVFSKKMSDAAKVLWSRNNENVTSPSKPKHSLSISKALPKLCSSSSSASSDITTPTPSLKFSKPTPAQVWTYAKYIDFVLDGHAFCDFYESKGWKVGNTPMKSWQAAVRTWKKRGSQNGGVSQQSQNSSQRSENLKAKWKAAGLSPCHGKPLEAHGDGPRRCAECLGSYP